MLLNKILLGMVVKNFIEDPTDEIRSSDDEVEVLGSKENTYKREKN